MRSVVASPAASRALLSPSAFRDAPDRKQQPYDRFIPNRAAMDFETASDVLQAQSSSSSSSSSTSSMDEGGISGAARILAFKAKAPAAPINPLPSRSSSAAAAAAAAAAALASRRAPVPSQPERVLDAPDLVDDFYLNLLSWSSRNTLAVGLGRDVYLWKASDGTVSVLNSEAGSNGSNGNAVEGDYVSSVSWAGDGRHVAIGIARASAGAGAGSARQHEVQLWDAAAGRQLRSLKGHAARVASLAWNGSTLSSGGRDSLILNHDVRAREHVVASLSDNGHSAEVCGLAWDRSGRYLASGGNDNVVCVWEPSARATASSSSSSSSNSTANGVPVFRPRHRFTDHCAAVKALAWCPFQPAVLASGGGAADRSIRTWNAHTGAALSSADAGAQVTSLAWAPLADGSRELLSAHGYSSAPNAPSNGLAIWKYPSLARVATVGVAGVGGAAGATAANAVATNGAGAHGARVLHMSVSPDGRTVATAAADETLRFWKVFGGSDDEASSLSASAALAAKAKGGSGASSSSSSSSLPRQGSMAAVTVR